METPKFERPDDPRSPEEQEKEEKRLSAAFQAILEGDENFAKELGVNIEEDGEEKTIEKLFGDSKEEQERKAEGIEIKKVLEKNSPQAIYFDVLVKEHPDLGVSIKEAVDKKGENMDDFISVSIKIDQKNGDFLKALYQDKVLEFLIKDNFNEDDHEEAIKDGLFSKEVADGLLQKTYQKIKEAEVWEKDSPLTESELRGIIAEHINRILLE